MKNSVRSLFLAAASLSLGLACAPTHAQATPAATPKFAVLVGIIDYHQPGVPKLEGCLHDVRDMKQKLISEFGFDAKNIVTLTDAQAKRGDIVKAVRAQLRDKARQNPGGTFLFYFSGHGSQTEDVNGDEKLTDPNDTADETLVTYDNDLVDDDLDVLCKEVRGVKNFSGSLTVILDSCHSGTATRDVDEPGAPHVRSAPPSNARIVAPLKEDSPILGDTGAGSFTSLSGCLATQTSEDKSFPVPASKNSKAPERNEYHGVLTYYLLQFMDAATKDTTNLQLWTQVASVLSGQYDQLPQLEGGRPNQPFLGGALKTTTAPITYSLTGTTLTFSKGFEAGAVQGGFILVLNDGNPKGQLAISSAKLGEATATVPANLKIAPTGTVELLTPYFGSKPLKIGFGHSVNADNPVAARLKEHYKGDKTHFAQLAVAGETPDVFLLRSDYGSAFPTANSPQADFKQQGYFLAVAPGGQPIFHFFISAKADGDISAEGETKLFDTLSNYIAQRNVKTLSNQNKMGLTAAQAVSIETYRMNGTLDGTHWHANTDSLKPIDLKKEDLSVNEGIRFEFENQTGQPLYVAVLWLSEDGGITPLQGADNQAQLVLAPKGHAESSKSTANYRVLPPIGTETIKVLVSSKPINVWYLDRRPVRGTVPKDLLSPLDMIAGQSLGTRSPQAEDQPGFESWDAEALLLSITS